MRNWCLAMLALGCAEMPASDNPLDPVVVEEPAAEPAVEPVQPAPPPAPTETEVVIDEVAEAAKKIVKGEDPVGPKTKAKVQVKTAKAKAKGQKARLRMKQATRSMGGPIQLVTAIPSAVPPRAILSLPDGKEIVVKPGQMVPEVGLVVLSIEAGKVEISRVESAGDRATVHNEVLVASQ